MSYRLRIRLAPDFDLKPVRKAIADLIESLGDTRTPRRFPAPTAAGCSRPPFPAPVFPSLRLQSTVGFARG
jgi:hypothetical protein